MTNREIMISALKKHTISLLRENGFVGTFPHYRRVCDDSIDLICFQTNKYGGSFTVEISAVFPNRENNNYNGDLNKKTPRCDGTCERYRLPGMFDGWFYYTDVYRKWDFFIGNTYHNVSEKDADSFIPPRCYKLVQKFNEEIAIDTCHELNRQLVKAYKWLEKFKKKI